MEETKNVEIEQTQIDVQIKKERKPRTEAQKAAFEKCRLARAERLKVKKESSLAPVQEVDISPPVQATEEIQVQPESVQPELVSEPIKKQRRPRVKKTPKVPEAQAPFKVTFY